MCAYNIVVCITAVTVYLYGTYIFIYLVYLYRWVVENTSLRFS